MTPPTNTRSSASGNSKDRYKLVFDIAIVLCCKLTLIFTLWYFFFGPDKRTEINADTVAAGILERAPAAADENMTTIKPGDKQ